MSCHRFGPFLLLASRRQLFEGSRQVKLGARALDLLVILVERAGAVVSKQELMAQVWPQEVVEENTLRVHMAALRKALGAGDDAPRYIANIAGRGYSFVAPTVAVDACPVAPPDARLAASAPLPPGGGDTSATRAIHAPAVSGPETHAPVPPWLQHLPRPGALLLGREDTLEALDRQLARYGFVSLVGPGGIGKTSVAVAAARQVGERYREGLWFVDLAALAPHASPLDVAFAIAGAVGVERCIERLHERLRARLAANAAGERRLLILDNCEHVVKAVASLVETLLAPTPGLHLLVTSREPLRAMGEQVYLLPCLPMPGDGVGSMEEALHYPAVALFVQRARAADQTFEPGDADAVWIAHICHGLDGVPLAIEHAAAMVRTFGLKALAASLDDRFLLLCGTHRNAISRHQNLQALLHWGYDLLGDDERRLLRWLSVVRGPIPLSDILSFIPPEMMDRQAVMEAVHNLVLKSWLFPRPGDLPAYRMHAMARSFAHQMLMAEAQQAPFQLRQRDLAFHHAALPRRAAPPPLLSRLND
ncbi:AAA domain-containing protein [Roseateles sp. YR242]|uniref:ATP-binding protein n=1 Tax=Roseateles sp. YR242 TaxID=1855305 RepID=UPI0008C648C6|nr:winged helix-turn-helix domain-containing protein [Roseateles sp. YR242]SEK40680.1 AAA domain-containing protein [Roseateles sp. YR242]